MTSDPPAKIFFSCRPGDSAEMTARIYHRLVEQFGEENILCEASATAAGVDFHTLIRERASECRFLFVVIGESWLHAAEADGRRCLANPGDPVHLEVVAGLESNVEMVPIYVEGGQPLEEDDLPDPLKPLARCHGISIRPGSDFEHDMLHLLRNISPGFRPNPLFTPRVAWALIGVSLMLCLGASFFALTEQSSPSTDRVQIRFFLNEVFLLESMELPRHQLGGEEGEAPFADQGLMEGIESAREHLLERGRALLVSIEPGAPDRDLLEVTLHTLGRASELLPDRLPPGMPPWLEQRAQAVRAGVDDLESRSLTHRRLAQWSILGFFLLMTAVFGLISLVLSPQIYSVSAFAQSSLQQIRVFQGFALIALWMVGRLLWDTGVVMAMEIEGAFLLAIHYLPPALFGAGLLAFALRRVGGSWKDLGCYLPADKRETGTWILLSYTGFAMALPVCFVAGWLSSTILPAQPEDVEPLLPLVWDTFARGHGWVLFAVAGGIAPLIEELLFRGFFYGVLRGAMGATRANIIQAFTFAFLHCAPSKFLVLFALGIVLGLLRERTGSLLSSMLLHATWNGGTLLAFSFLFGS